MPYGLYLTVTHTGTTTATLLLNDILATNSPSYRGVGPVYIQPNATVDLIFSDSVELSFENGAIRGFMNLGYLTAVLNFGSGFVGAGGDLDGSYPNPTVVGIQGIPIQNAGGPANGDALLFNSLTNQWEHSPIVFGGGPPVGPAGGDLGGLYPNPTTVGLQTNPVDNAAPNANDALVWDGAKWTPTPVGYALQATWGQFSDSSDQTFAGGAFVVEYNTVEGSNGVSIVNDPITLRPTRISVSQSGVYSISISPQILHTGGGNEIVTFWGRIDGLDIPRSASSLEMGNNNNRVLPFMEFITYMNGGQYFEWVFTSTNGTNLSLKSFVAAGGIPAIPSVVLNVKRLGS